MARSNRKSRGDYVSPVGSALRTVRGGAHAKGCPRARVLDDLTVENNHFDGRVRVYPRLFSFVVAFSRFDSVAPVCAIPEDGGRCLSFLPPVGTSAPNNTTLLANVSPLRIGARSRKSRVEPPAAKNLDSMLNRTNFTILWTIIENVCTAKPCASRTSCQTL